MNLVLWFLVVFAIGMMTGGRASSPRNSFGDLGEALGLALLIMTALVALGRWLAFLP